MIKSIIINIAVVMMVFIARFTEKLTGVKPIKVHDIGSRAKKMKRLQITIDMEGETFQGNNEGIEVARILRSLASTYELGVAFNDGILDSNGNEIGKAVVSK